MHNVGLGGMHVFLRKDAFKKVTGFALIAFDIEALTLPPRF